MGARTQSVAELTVFYDGGCSLCRASVARVQRFDTQHRIEFLDVHDPAVQKRYPQIDPEVAMRWMQAIGADGRVWSGAEAWARIGMLLPSWKILAWLLLVPGVRWIAGGIYKLIARNRYRWNRAACSDGSCSLHSGGDAHSK
jgi:predicted DCC family thiol-disulfide oxidoreductase YuxK